MRNYIFILLAAVFLCCQPKSDGLPHKIVCVLVDLSESTHKSEIRQCYLKNLKIILNKMNPGDALVVHAITEKSIAELDFIVQREFSTFHPSTDNVLIRRKELAEFNQKQLAIKDSLVVILNTALLQPSRKILHTDIMSSLHMGARIAKSYAQPGKILIFFSDMIEDSPKYNFAREKLTEHRIHQIIATEKTRMPDLNGVKIYVIGATPGSSEQFFRIQDFWLAYFQACGASLALKDYGASLVAFDE